MPSPAQWSSFGHTSLTDRRRSRAVTRQRPGRLLIEHRPCCGQATVPPGMASPTKDEWRRRAKTARQAIAIDHDAHVESLSVFLTELRRPGDPTAGRADGWVLVYQPMDGEVDLGPLYAQTDLGRFAVTRTPTEGFDLTVHPLGGATERHRYGFEQPTEDTPVIADADIAIALVPGLAFDRLGNRLGHGAGYYDRLLGRLRPAAPLVGITGGYVVAELPVDAHDVPMTHLCGPFGVEPVPVPDPQE